MTARAAARPIGRVAVAIVAAAAAGGGALASTAVRAAEPVDPQLRWSVSPRAVRLPGATELRYRLRIATGEETERFALTLQAPRLEALAGSRTRAVAEGTTITPLTSATLEGAGRLEGTMTTIATLGCTPGVALAPHGYEPRNETYVVEIPPRSVSFVVARYRTGTVDLWPGSDLRLTAHIAPEADRYGAPTLARAHTIRSPGVAISGRTGTRIDLWTSPASSRSGVPRLQPEVASGAPLTVHGRATPPPPGRRVTLELRHAGGARERSRVLARPRTLPDGRFTWRGRVPDRGGPYQLWAQTPAAARIAADYTCPVTFRARG
jgi:hypothetical protein